MKKLKVKEFLINEDDTITAIAITTKPAIGVDFITFSEQELEEKLEEIKFTIINEEKRIFAGPLMIPDKYIYRIDEKTGEEYVGKFSTKTIEQISEIYMYKANQKNINMEHKVPIYTGICITQNWLIEDNKIDKAFSEKFGYKNLPIGTWMGMMKVFDKDLWEDLKQSNFKGFSVEGIFLIKEVGEITEDQLFVSKFNDVLNSDIADEDKLLKLAYLLALRESDLK